MARRCRWDSINVRLRIGDTDVPLRSTPLRDGGAALEYHRLENSGRIAIVLYVAEECHASAGTVTGVSFVDTHCGNGFRPPLAGRTPSSTPTGD